MNDIDTKPKTLNVEGIPDDRSGLTYYVAFTYMGDEKEQTSRVYETNNPDKAIEFMNLILNTNEHAQQTVGHPGSILIFAGWTSTFDLMWEPRKEGVVEVEPQKGYDDFVTSEIVGEEIG